MQSRAALLHDLNALQDVALLALLKARQGAQPMRGGRRLQLADGRNLEPFGQQPRRLGTDPGHVQQVRHAGRDRAPELLVRRDGPRGQVLGDLLGQVRADAGKLLELAAAGHAIQVAAEAFKMLGGSPVGADAKWVLAPVFKEIGPPGEDRGDVALLHGATRVSRSP